MVIVYAIVCKETNHAYVGATAGKLNKRFREHRCLAKSGKHTSPKVSDEWAKYGDDSFHSVVLELLEFPTLIEKREAELKWLKHYDELGLLLNASLISFAPTPEAIRKGIEAARHIPKIQTLEANNKRRQAQLGIPKNHGHKISATKRARKLSDEIV